MVNNTSISQYSMTGSSGKFPVFGQLNPYTWAHKKFAWAMGMDKEYVVSRKALSDVLKVIHLQSDEARREDSRRMGFQ